MVFYFKKLPELVVGMHTSLMETKLSTSTAKLTAKHCILTATVSARASSTRNMAKVLGVHHHNVSVPIQCRSLCVTMSYLWKLTMKNKKSDCILLVIEVVVLKHWASDTRVNPNKVDVTKRRLETGVFEKKPTHFSMET